MLVPQATHARGAPVGVAAGAPGARAPGAPAPLLAKPRDFGLAAGDAILWAYASRTQEDGSTVLRFAYKRTGKQPHGRFVPLPMPPVQGSVAYSGVRGEFLHIVFHDGTHIRYAPRPILPLGIGPDVSTVEMVLPNSARPAALAPDGTHEVLYAIVRAPVARDLRPPDNPAHDATRAPTRDTGPGRGRAPTDRPRERQTESAKPNADPTDPGAAATGLDTERKPPNAQPTASQASPDRPAPAWVILRYDRARWVLDRDAPRDLPADGRVAALLAAGGRIHLLYQPDAAATAIRHRFSSQPGDAWSDPVPTAWPATAVIGAAGWWDDQPVLLIAEPDRRGATFDVWRLAGDAWVRRATLRDDAGRAVRFAGPVSAAVFASRAVIARRDNAGEVEAGSWSLDTGRPVEPIQVLRPLIPPPAPVVGHTIRSMLEFACVVGLIGVIFAWRRERFVSAAPLRADLKAAGMLHRFVAFMIDMIILLPVPATLYFVWLGRDGMMLGGGGWALSDPRTAQQAGASWMLMGTAGAFFVYGTVFEAAMGATPGKRIMGLRLAREDGGTCGFGAIVLRNAMRLIEFYVVPIALLVPLTRSRQRLGDLVAKTVVVEPAPPPASATRPDGLAGPADPDGHDDAPAE
ncbi:MAG: RDD family protein [Phycisphaerae bacterium]